MLCGFVVAFSSCKDDNTETPDLRLFKPAVSDVTGTAASVSCEAAFALEQYAGISKGFAYGPASADPATYAQMTAPTVEGRTLSCRLSGLEPETVYHVYAYIDAGLSRIVSETAEFETRAVAGDEPVLEITSLTSLSVPAATGNYTITYTVANPGEEPWAEADCTAAWVNSFDNSDAGEIEFTVDENTGAERTAVVTVSYPGAEPRTVTLKQAAASQEKPDVPEVTETLTAGNGNWPKSYNKTEVKVGQYTYYANDVADYGNGIQFRKNSGSLSNVDDMGAVRSISVVFKGNSPSHDMTLYLGATPQSTTEDLEAVKSGDAYLFDCSALSYNYFTLNSNDGACYIESITIVCGGEGGVTPPDPETEEPAFGEPSYSDLTKNSATISCSYTYAGKGSVTEAYFLYASTGGSEQRVDLASAGPGTKSASLTGLAPATRYSFRLCVTLDGKTFRSASGTLLTLDESGKPSTDVRYTGWAELPTEDGDKIGKEYFYAYHLCPDYPSSARVKARNFSTCYSKSLRCPVWVAAPLHDCYTGSVTRTDAYRNDPEISCTQAGKWSGYTRGHMLGSNERRVTTNVNRDVFYYSNIGPQIQTYFNTGGGQWNTAEDWVDKQWRGLADTCYQIVGTYWENTNKVVGGTTIPTHYYTVLLKAKKSAGRKWVVNCSADELQCIAIMVRHKAYSKGEVVKPAEFESKGVFKSVAEIEQLTGHTFFPNVPNAPKSSYNVADWNF